VKMVPCSTFLDFDSHIIANLFYILYCQAAASQSE